MVDRSIVHFVVQLLRSLDIPIATEVVEELIEVILTHELNHFMKKSLFQEVAGANFLQEVKLLPTIGFPDPIIPLFPSFVVASVFSIIHNSITIGVEVGQVNDS